MIDNAMGRLKPRGYSLATLEQRHLNRDRSADKGEDAWRMRYSELDGVPLADWPEAARTYPLDDAEGTLLVWGKQVCTEPNRFEQVRAAFALHLMSCWGVCTSAHQIQRLEQSIAADYERYTEMLTTTGLIRANGSKNTKAAKELMLASCQVVALTDTGKKNFETSHIDQDDPPHDEGWKKYIKLDADSCEASGNDLLHAYAKRITLASILNTHIPDLRRGTGTEPIQPSYNTFLETGRTSCWKSKIVNGYQIQNVLRNLSKEHEAVGIGIRECFTARPGYVFIDCDYPQLELCCVAQVILDEWGHSTLADAINAGQDVHALMLATMLGISYADVLASDQSKRVLAKIANFGFWGGMGGMGIVGFARGYGVSMTPQEGYELKAQFMEAWSPDTHQYFQWVSEAVDPDTGRVPMQTFRNGIRRGQVAYCAACNGEFQALGAAVAKRACWDVARACYTTGGALPGVRPWGFIHDQIIAECPEDRALELAPVMGQIMKDAAKKHIPDIDFTIKPALSKHWFKGAEGCKQLWYPKGWEQ